MNDSVVAHNEELLNKYLSIRGPYYSAFPSPGLWSEQFSSDDYENALKEILLSDPQLPLQFYLHFPFCKNQCWYCQCYQLVTNKESEIGKIVEYTLKEMDLLIDFFNRNSIKPNFIEAHIGGGSPCYMDLELFDRIIDKLNSFIDIKKLTEFAIEVDPRNVDKERIKHYHEKGVNRISFGIQDVDMEVQKAINRVQPIELIEDLLTVRHLFKSVNFDLIYGLPRQTRKSIIKSLETVMTLSPDQIAFCVLGYRPDVFKHNALIKESELPSWIDKAYMWEDAVSFLVAHGYERIGMDHFAKPTSELAIAKKNKKLFHYLMGYSAGRFEDHIAVGPSGMTKAVNHYSGNFYDLSSYYAALDNGKFPVMRGYRLSKDLMMRRDIMNMIMVYYRLDFSDIENKYGINFNEYFKKELDGLDEFVKIEVLNLTDRDLAVTKLGNYFFRHICAVFDNLGKEYKHNVETGVKSGVC